MSKLGREEKLSIHSACEAGVAGALPVVLDTARRTSRKCISGYSNLLNACMRAALEVVQYVVLKGLCLNTPAHVAFAVQMRHVPGSRLSRSRHNQDQSCWN